MDYCEFFYQVFGSHFDGTFTADDPTFLQIYSDEETNSSWVAWVLVNLQQIYIFEWTIPLSFVWSIPLSRCALWWQHVVGSAMALNYYLQHDHKMMCIIITASWKDTEAESNSISLNLEQSEHSGNL